MLFQQTRGAQVFRDRTLMRCLLLSGKSHCTIAQLIDSYKVGLPAPSDHGRGGKRTRVSAPKTEVVAVLKAAFKQFPRLGDVQEKRGDREIQLKSWPNSVKGQILFHNELMKCCRVSLLEVSKKRAHFHESRPRIVPEVAMQEAAGNVPVPAAEDAGVLEVPVAGAVAPNTPPDGPRRS